MSKKYIGEKIKNRVSQFDEMLQENPRAKNNSETPKSKRVMREEVKISSSRIKDKLDLFEEKSKLKKNIQKEEIKINGSRIKDRLNIFEDKSKKVPAKEKHIRKDIDNNFTGRIKLFEGNSEKRSTSPRIKKNESRIVSKWIVKEPPKMKK